MKNTVETNDRMGAYNGNALSRALPRRAIVKTGGAVLAGTALAGFRQVSARQATPGATPASGALPSGGQPVPELTAFDDAMTSAMTTWAIPGGQLAVAKDGRLVLNRAYGLADVEQREPVGPRSLFRIASVTKTITAVAILALVDDGKLSLDDKAFPLLDLAPPAGATVDPRLNEITVRQLLIHAGGWDSSKSYDPQYLPWSRMAAATIGLEDPAQAETIVRFMLGQPLDFDPGTESVYSNFGFNVLGRVIERASGQSYANYTLARVLNPAGVTDMLLGRTRLADRAPGEVRYYGPKGQAARPSVYWGEGFVPVGYGSFYMPALDAHGGWIATAADLVRFALAVDGTRGTALLAPASIKAMIETPRPKAGATGAGNAPTSFGLGWDMKPVAGGAEWSHAGALEGSNASWLFRGPGGLAIAFIFNTLPEDFVPFFTHTVDAVRKAAAAVTTWPTHDLFAG